MEKNRVPTLNMEYNGSHVRGWDNKNLTLHKGREMHYFTFFQFSFIHSSPFGKSIDQIIGGVYDGSR